jgi:hypothetical protein
MNAACTSLGPYTASFCNTTAGELDSLSAEVALAITPFTYALLATGTLYAVDGTIKLADLGVCTVSFIVDKVSKVSKLRFSSRGGDELEVVNEYEILNERQIKEKEEPASRWRRFVTGWNSVFKTGRSVSVASLCLFSGAPLYKVIQLLNSSGSLSAKCPHFEADAIQGCEWANQWLLDVIKQIFHGTVQQP